MEMIRLSVLSVVILFSSFFTFLYIFLSAFFGGSFTVLVDVNSVGEAVFEFVLLCFFTFFLLFDFFKRNVWGG